MWSFLPWSRGQTRANQSIDRSVERDNGEETGISLLRVQQQIDRWRAPLAAYELAVGKKSLLDYVLTMFQRIAREQVGARIDAGQFVSATELVRAAGSDFDISASEGAQILATQIDRGTRRPIRSYTNRPGDSDRRSVSGEGGSGIMRTTHRASSGAHIGTGFPQSLQRIEGREAISSATLDASNVEESNTSPPMNIGDWLAKDPSEIASTLWENKALHYATARESLQFEAIATVWARTVVAERRLSISDIPAAVLHWDREDQAFRLGKVVPSVVADRAREIDLAVLHSSRAARFGQLTLESGRKRVVALDPDAPGLNRWSISRMPEKKRREPPDIGGSHVEL